MAKIAIILGRLVIGGTTMDTLQVARHLQQEHELLLITGGGQKDEFEAAYLTEHLPSIRHERIQGFGGSIQPWQDWQSYRQLRKVLRRFQPDIVHTHTAKAGLIGRLAAAAEKVPVIVHTYHGLLFHGYYKPWISRLIVRMERWLATKTTRIIALSNMQRQQIVEQYRVCSHEKIAVVPLGIELAAFQEQREEKRRYFRSKYKLPDSAIAIGIVGRIVPIKNHELFIQTVALLQKARPRLRFFVVGDGHLRRKLQQTCAQLGIDQAYFPEEPRLATVVFTSWITEVDKVMAGLDMIVLTSHNEGTPVSLMEAQAAGKPVVSTKAGGIDDIVIDGKTGFTVAEHQPEQLAEAIIKIADQPLLMQAMGDAGQAMAEQQFRKERQVNDLNKLYLSLLANH